jgi:N-acyl-D-aspartate/D-glutamate deacylase
MKLEQAIEKISSKPAAAAGIKDRGVIRKRAKADIVIFDPEAVNDLATMENPYRRATGFGWVVVNGRLAVADGQLTKVGSGKVLRL